MEEKTTMTFKISPAEKAFIKQIAEDEDKSASAVIRTAIREQYKDEIFKCNRGKGAK